MSWGRGEQKIPETNLTRTEESIKREILLRTNLGKKVQGVREL